VRNRRCSLAILLSVALWPALAAAAPTVKELVDQAVHAVRVQCYEARMRFITPMDGGQEQVAYVYHLAPDLYRVEPLSGGEPAEWCYIENAAEMVRVWLKTRLVEQMPDRQFGLNDDLTVTFLRMLSGRGGTTVLNGMSGPYQVYVLRQDGTEDAPYTITVGVDQGTYYPVFLLVNDVKSRRKVYYQMESITYVRPSQLRDDLFTYAEPRAQQRLAPRRIGPPPGVSRELPLYPTWLPEGYRIEAISVLNYRPGEKDAEASPALIFQCQAYDAGNDLISIFQTRSLSADLDLSSNCNQEGCGFAVRETDGWLITVVGPLKMDTLLKIADSLAPADDAVQALLSRTRDRDRVLRQFTSD
jgi:hypothetical protein